MSEIVTLEDPLGVAHAAGERFLAAAVEAVRDIAVRSDVLQRPPNCIDTVAEIVRAEDGDGAAIVDQDRDLFRHQQPAERHDAGAGADDPVHDLENVDRVAHQNGDLVALADSGGDELVRDAVHIAVEIAPGSAHIAANDGFLARMEPGVRRPEVGQEDLGIVDGRHHPAVERPEARDREHRNFRCSLVGRYFPANGQRTARP